MIKKLLLIAATSGFFFSYQSIASYLTIDTLKAAPDATQFVTIMNHLANPAVTSIIQSDIMVKYYDGTGKNPPCWIENNISYHDHPVVSGAGGKNGCGKSGISPPAIVAIDVIPLKSVMGKTYQDVTKVVINPDKFYTTIIIEQETAPIFNPNGTLASPGTIKVRQLTEENTTPK